MLIKRTITVLSLGFICANIVGCASIVSGTNQSLSVTTGNVAGATCSLENSKGRWYVNKTPGSVVVNRSFSDMAVSCYKPGFHESHRIVPSHTKAMAFGNALFGGVPGVAVDVADGAAYDYPSEVNVNMHR